MSTYLRKFQTLSDFNAAKAAGTLDCPNTALIMADGSVKYTPTLVKENIGIRGANGVCYTLTEWNALSAANKPTPVGVYIYDDATGKGFVIHNTLISDYRWASENVLISGVTTTEEQSEALLDKEGEENTQAVIDFSLSVEAPAGFTCPIFTWARGLDFVDSSLEGYIPAAGELDMIRANISYINQCRTIISQSEIPLNQQHFWSSTQAQSSAAWFWASTMWFKHSKTNQKYALAIASF